MFAVNLILGGLGASGTARALGSALHHSLAGEKLANSFDLGMLLELITQPSVRLFSHSGGVLLFAVLYFLFLLFVTPGIIAVYLADRRLSSGEFFAAAGTFFWTFVRLALWSLIPFVLVNLLYQGIQALAHYAGDRAVADQTGFYIVVVGSMPVLLLFVWVRLWFDLAQVRAVALDEHRTRRDVAHAFRWALRQAWPTYWTYVGIGLLAWITTVLALLLWTKVPARAVPVTFVLLEIVMLAHIFGRLWQKACATTWYTLHPEPEPVELPPYQPIRGTHIPETAASVPDVDAPLSPEIESPPQHLPEVERDRQD